MIPCEPLDSPQKTRMPTALTAAQTRFLRGQAHDLRAMLQTGAKGLTDALVAELDLALEQHELVKVKVAGQGGLGDVILHPDFANNRYVYLSWVEAGDGDTRGAVVGRHGGGARRLANDRIFMPRS